LRLDLREHRRPQQPPTRGAGDEVATVAPGQPVHGRAARHVAAPGETEHDAGVERAAAGEERTHRHGAVGRYERKDILERRQHSDQRVQEAGWEVLEEREQVGQTAGLTVSSATAITATPSPRPIHPMPSLVLALTEMVEKPATRAPASRSRMSSMYGVRRGCSAITVMSALTKLKPASTTRRYARFSRSRESASFQRRFVGGNIVPMSP